MALQIAVSDSLKRRIERFDAQRLQAFQLAAADIARGRAKGEHAGRSPHSQREMYFYESGGYTLYYSMAPGQQHMLVFEEFLSPDEGDVIMDTFAEGPD